MPIRPRNRERKYLGKCFCTEDEDELVFFERFEPLEVSVPSLESISSFHKFQSCNATQGCWQVGKIEPASASTCRPSHLHLTCICIHPRTPTHALALRPHNFSLTTLTPDLQVSNLQVRVNSPDVTHLFLLSRFFISFAPELNLLGRIISTELDLLICTLLEDLEP